MVQSLTIRSPYPITPLSEKTGTGMVVGFAMYIRNSSTFIRREDLENRLCIWVEVKFLTKAACPYKFYI